MSSSSTTHRLRWAVLPALLLTLVLAACGGTTTVDESAALDANVTGTVTYMQRIALVPGSVVTVQVQDVSRMDAPAEIIGEQVITTTDQQVPIAFSVPYSSAAIVDSNRYVVRATIDSPEGNLIFTSDTAIPVITNGAPTSGVEVMVVPVGGGAAAAPDASVTGTVTYMQRIALVPGSVITVQIQDISRMDAPAEVIGEQVITTTDQQVPVAFEVPYGTADINDRSMYALQARIESPDGQLLFINDTITPVISNGAPTSDIEMVLVPVGGSGAAPAPDASVTGTVTYMPRIALVPGTVITVQIQDVSRQDVAAQIIGEQVIVTNGEQVPVAFEVPYSTADINDANTYALQARIESPEGQLLFINDTFTPVLTNGAPSADVEVMVVPVGGGATTDSTITGTVTYLQRIALAPGSIITVQLQDISRADAPATVLGETVITTSGEQVPVPFEVSYSAADLQDNGRYAVRATITDPAGALIFTSDTVIPVISNDAPTENVEIVVVPAG